MKNSLASITRIAGGELWLRRKFYRQFGYQLRTSQAATFTEKLFTRMIVLNRHCPVLYRQLADKQTAREYVRSRLGNDVLIPMLWSGEDPNDIPFESLPERFVVKPNNGSGTVIVVREVFDKENIVKTARNWLAEDYYWRQREAQYHGITPAVMIEELLGDPKSYPLDYKVWCFNGEPKLVQVDNHARSIDLFYSTDWQKTSLTYRNNSEADIPKPKNLTALLDIARALSAGFDFARIDLYSIGDRAYFGEVTFTPRSGNFHFKPDSWNRILGDWWTVNEW
ncbi:hypothetical protein N9H37_01450 [Congregibacter sp.]|nr:ATP-grasp fold amidoligase family protein [Congregibacter sp.]MDA8962006.1 hypothetical protein [Congregibacter sp.]